jgi:isopropylmalate/homocitrate/citramalate synthase
MEGARKLLYSWNHLEKRAFQSVQIEEDIRDALQSIRAVQPSLPQRQDLLSLSAKVGIQYALLGFPAASLREHQRCCALVDHIATQRLATKPVLMARPLESDLRPILEIQQRSSIPIAVDTFISISALRLSVEGWTLEEALGKIRKTAAVASRAGLALRVSFEDSSRTAPAELADAVAQVLDTGAGAITLCDTVGDCLPNGAAHTTSFVRNQIDRSGRGLQLGWHGHNDRGLSLANAIAAVEAGANIVSGTFMGFGERTGNVPLEQLIVILHEAGNRSYDLTHLQAVCELFSASSRMSVPPNLPIVGLDAFSTSTGTHAAAILKSRKMGRDFEDLIYSAVEASALGRTQTLLIGPNSGRNAVCAALEQCSIVPTEDLVSLLLEHCKQRERCFESSEEVRAFVARTRK